MATRETIVKIIVSLALICFPSFLSRVCDTGWFGSSCSFICRCTTGNCSKDGSCEGNGVCLVGWFGPQCQYVDLASNRSSIVELTDGRDDTCIFARSTVEVSLDRSYVFSWLRIHLSHPGFLKTVSVHFTQNRGYLDCSKMKSTSIDERTLDIYCELHDTVEAVNLTGEGVKYLCSLYVSGGRNVALKQDTEQSSTYSENSANTSSILTEFTADKAVDGNKSMDFFDMSCSSTIPGEANISWTVRFSLPHILTRYVLYSTQDQGHSLNRFLITSYNSIGQTVFHYADNTPDSNVTVYAVNSRVTTDPITQVIIRTNNPVRRLVLCEVEIYGDSVCQTGRFGRECEHRCECDQGSPCFANTGQCPNGCGPGFDGGSCDKMCPTGSYGQGCGFLCNPNCGKSRQMIDSTTCHNVNGSCILGCSPGYSDPFCSTDTSGKPTYNLVVGLTIPAIVLILLFSFLLALYLKIGAIKKSKPVAEKNASVAESNPQAEAPDNDDASPAESRVSVHEEEVEEIKEASGDEEPDAAAPAATPDPNKV